MTERIAAAEQKHRLRKQVKSVRWLIFWVVLAQFAAEVLVEAAVSFMANPPHPYIRIALVEVLAIGVPLIVYSRSLWRIYGKNIRADLMIKPCRIELMALSAVLGITGQFVMMTLNMPANIYISEVLNHQSEDAIPVAIEWYEMFVGLGAVVIIPAFLEEFLMRGLLLGTFNRCNTKAAVIFSTLVFALMHMRLGEIAGFVFMGVMAALILLRTRSLYASMIYHGFSNLTALIFGFILAGVLDQLLVIFILAIVFFALTLVIFIARSKPVKGERILKTSALITGSMFSMPVILSVIVVILRQFLL